MFSWSEHHYLILHSVFAVFNNTQDINRKNNPPSPPIIESRVDYKSKTELHLT